jgi:hypothetical protein
MTELANKSQMVELTNLSLLDQEDMNFKLSTELAKRTEEIRELIGKKKKIEEECRGLQEAHGK